jgi:hypothetical protein
LSKKKKKTKKIVLDGDVLPTQSDQQPTDDNELVLGKKKPKKDIRIDELPAEDQRVLFLSFFATANLIWSLLGRRSRCWCWAN